MANFGTAKVFHFVSLLYREDVHISVKIIVKVKNYTWFRNDVALTFKRIVFWTVELAWSILSRIDLTRIENFLLEIREKLSKEGFFSEWVHDLSYAHKCNANIPDN